MSMSPSHSAVSPPHRAEEKKEARSRLSCFHVTERETQDVHGDSGGARFKALLSD